MTTSNKKGVISEVTKGRHHQFLQRVTPTLVMPLFGTVQTDRAMHERLSDA